MLIINSGFTYGPIEVLILNEDDEVIQKYK